MLASPPPCEIPETVRNPALANHTLLQSAIVAFGRGRALILRVIKIRAHANFHPRSDPPSFILDRIIHDVRIWEIPVIFLISTIFVGRLFLAGDFQHFWVDGQSTFPRSFWTRSSCTLAGLLCSGRGNGYRESHASYVTDTDIDTTFDGYARFERRASRQFASYMTLFSAVVLINVMLEGIIPPETV